MRTDGYVGAATCEFEIAPAQLTVKVADAERFEGESNPEFSATLESKVDTAGVKLTFTCDADENSPAGTYAIGATVADSNFDVTVEPGTLTVKKKQEPVDPDQPDPDQPEPDNPDPDQPGPDNPDKPEPDQPGPDQPDPDNPDKPEPDKPDGPDPSEPDKPDPDKPDPDKPEPDNPDKPDPDKPEPDRPSDPDKPGKPDSDNDNGDPQSPATPDKADGSKDKQTGTVNRVEESRKESSTSRSKTLADTGDRMPVALAVAAAAVASIALGLDLLRRRHPRG